MDYEGFNEDSNLLFTEKSIRRGFIRKVYAILTAQLLVTSAFIAFFLYVPKLSLVARQNPGIYIAALVATFVLVIVLTCCESVRRRWPLNIIMLSIFTICEGWLLGSISSFYGKDEVLLAVGITIVVVFALTIFAFQTKFDMTGCHMFLFVALVLLMIFGILCIFSATGYVFSRSRNLLKRPFDMDGYKELKEEIINLVYSSLGALIFSGYLVLDTQLLMGNRKLSISPEEYIFAALSLYLDIINLFLYILQIINSSNN